MTISEASRHALHARLVEVLGPEEAVALMEYLPPVGWADVATKRDIDQLAVATKRDIDQLAVATKRDIDQLAVATKRDVDQLAVATKRDLDHLGIELRGEMAAMEGRLLHNMAQQARGMYFGIIATMLTTVGTVAAATAINH